MDKAAPAPLTVTLPGRPARDRARAVIETVLAEIAPAPKLTLRPALAVTAAPAAVMLAFTRMLREADNVTVANEIDAPPPSHRRRQR